MLKIDDLPHRYVLTASGWGQSPPSSDRDVLYRTDLRHDRAPDHGEQLLGSRTPAHGCCPLKPAAAMTWSRSSTVCASDAQTVVVGADLHGIDGLGRNVDAGPTVGSAVARAGSCTCAPVWLSSSAVLTWMPTEP
jgi:hypothetical protein